MGNGFEEATERIETLANMLTCEIEYKRTRAFRECLSQDLYKGGQDD